MSTVFLHIGTHKTGTTAIQRFLDRNRRVLARHGVCYPQFGSFASHPLAWAMGFSGKRVSDRQRKKLRARCERVFQRQISAAMKRGHNVVLSSEAFSAFNANRPFALDELGVLLKRHHLTDVKVVCYLRRQDDLVDSIYAERTKDGRPLELDRATKIWRLNYVRFLEYFSERFGPENIIIRPFERTQFVDGDLLTDFLSVLGVDRTDAYRLPQSKHRNFGFSRDVTTILSQCNASLTHPDGCHPQGMVKFLMKYFDKSTLTGGTLDRRWLSPEERRALRGRHEATNAQVAREYLGRDDGALFRERVDDGDASWEPYPGLPGDDGWYLVLRLLMARRRRVVTLGVLLLFAIVVFAAVAALWGV
jgi:hypothetical protein